LQRRLPNNRLAVLAIPISTSGRVTKIQTQDPFPGAMHKLPKTKEASLGNQLACNQKMSRCFAKTTGSEILDVVMPR